MEIEETTLNEARRLAKAGYYEQSQRFFRVAALETPGSAEVYTEWAETLMKLGRTDEAITKNIKALSRDGRNLRALVQMGKLMEAIREDETAVKYYETALQTECDYAPAINEMAAMSLRKGEPDKAEQMLKHLMDKKKENIRTYYVLQRVYWKKEEYMKSFECGMEGVKKWDPETDDISDRETLNFAMRSSAIHLYENEEYIQAMKNIEKRMQAVGVEQEDQKDTTWYQTDHHNLHRMINREMDMAAQSCGRYKEPRQSKPEQSHIGIYDFPYWQKMSEEIGKEEETEKKKVFMHHVITKMMNCGRDMFLEDKIYNEYKKLRGMQYIAMWKKYEDKLEYVGKAMKTNRVPPTAFRAFKVMNMAMAMHMKLLYGQDLLAKYESTSEEKRMAGMIFKEYMKYREKGHEPGDEYKLASYVAETVKMKRCLTLMEKPR